MNQDRTCNDAVDTCNDAVDISNDAVDTSAYNERVSLTV